MLTHISTYSNLHDNMSMQRYQKKKYPLYKAVARRGKIYGPAIGQLSSDVLYLKSIINSEAKAFYTTTSNNFDEDTNPISLCAIIQGDLSTRRDGNVVLPRYINFRCHLNKSLNASALDHETFRCMLFMYSGESTSAAPSVTQSEIVHSPQNPMSTLNEANTGSKRDKSRRIEVLRDEIITVDKVSKTMVDLDWNVEINGPKTQSKQHMRFRSTTTEDPVSNGLYALIYSDTGSASSYKPTYTIHCKLVFYDN